MERPEPRTLAIAALVILPLAVWGWHLRSERLTVERRAAAAASQVAGRPVEVHCPGQVRRRLTTEIHDGEVQFFEACPPMRRSSPAGSATGSAG